MEGMVVDNEEDVAAAELILESKQGLLDVEDEASSIPCEKK
jgi:hypothetical protein